MKRSLILVALAVVLAGCSTARQSTGPDVGLHLTGTNLSASTLYFPGPLSTTMQLTVTNPTPEPVKLLSLDLQTVGNFSFRLRNGRTSVNQTIPANSSATITLAAWGTSRGGFLAESEPITIRETGYFTSPSHGSFMRITTDTLTPQ